MTERRKLIMGAGLLLVAALFVYRAFFSTPTPARRAPTTRTVPFNAIQGPNPATPRAAVQRAPGTRRRRMDTAPPPGAFDPTIRWDLLTKVESVTYQGTERNIFQYRAAAPPPPPKPVAPVVTASKPPGPAPPPPPPPIPLKFYGYAHKPGETLKRAFFVDGEEIFIAAEGETVNKRYRIVKIGVNTAEVEDTVTKHKQTLPMQES